MIQCPKCKTELTENDVFCFVCGHKMEQPLQQQSAAEGTAVLKPCPQCQTMPASADDVFCAECGFRLIPETPAVQEPPKEEIPPVQETPQVEEPVKEELPEQKQEEKTDEVAPQAPANEKPATEETPVIPVTPPVVEPPVTEAKPEPPVVPATPPVSEPVQSAAVPPVQQPQPQSFTQQPAATSPFQAPPKKKKSAGKVIFTIFLILLIVAVVGGGIFGFLIYNGNVSRQQVSFIPKSLLDMIPAAKGAADENTVSRYFVAYCSGQFDGTKEAVVSNVFNNVDIKADNDDAAEVAFREQGMSDIEKFTRFSNHFVYSFSKMGDAIDKREEIIDDLRAKGYKPQYVTVKK
jgi:hypothetical protein